MMLVSEGAINACAVILNITRDGQLVTQISLQVYRGFKGTACNRVASSGLWGLTSKYPSFPWTMQNHGFLQVGQVFFLGF